MTALVAVGLRCGHRVALAPSSELLGSLVDYGCCSSRSCRAIVCMAGAGQQENIDALPVEEQAAILCSMAACNAAAVPMAPYGSAVDSIVRRAYFGVPCLCNPPGAMTPEGVRDEWAEAEARLRVGPKRRRRARR